MKKLFTMLVVSFCGTMAYAQTDAISVNDVTIAKGGSTQMEVTVNNAASNTAFQFDLKLPAGVSVKSATMNSGAVTSNAEDTQSRKLLHNLYKESDNVYRFLSYDNANEVLTDGKVSITLEAADEAETAEVEIAGSDILVVNPEGTKTTQDNGDVASITVADGEKITIGKTGKSTLVSDKDLDFSTMESLNAYIATGYDKAASKIWLTRVKDVPAGTPIMLIGPKTEDKTTYVVPIATSSTYYPKNYLTGSASESVAVDNTNFLNMALQSGTFAPMSDETFPQGKCYLQLPKEVTSTEGNAFSFTMGKSGKKSYIGSSDLDFSNVEDLLAYIVTGYNKSGTIWLTRVNKVCAGTALYLVGTGGKAYNVPSASVQSSYINMLKGDAVNTIALPMTSTINEISYTNCVLQGGHFAPLGADEPSFPNGACYLPIPTSYIVASSRGEGNIISNSTEIAEVISLNLVGANEGADDATAISRIATEVDNDVWYNLNGQRIDTPTRKGLYIKNGKKVIVK